MSNPKSASGSQAATETNNADDDRTVSIPQRLVLTQDFELTRVEVEDTSTEIEQLAETFSSLVCRSSSEVSSQQMHKDIHNVLCSYKNNKTFQSAIISACLDSNIICALMANPVVKNFLMNMKQVGVGLNESYGHTKAAIGSMKEAKSGLSRSFDLAIKAITELLISIWNSLWNGQELWEAVISTMDIGDDTKEELMKFIFILLAMIKRCIMKRMYRPIG